MCVTGLLDKYKYSYLFNVMKAFRGMEVKLQAFLRRVLDEGLRQLHVATIFFSPG
jgi:hypothetical protein